MMERDLHHAVGLGIGLVDHRADIGQNDLQENDGDRLKMGQSLGLQLISWVLD